MKISIYTNNRGAAFTELIFAATLLFVIILVVNTIIFQILELMASTVGWGGK